MSDAVSGVETRRRARPATAAGIAAVVAVSLTLTLTLTLTQLGVPPARAATAPVAGAPSCPWATESAAQQFSPEQLAEQVVSRMTLAEKLGEVRLETRDGYENENAGVPRLCIPPLTLEDGPDGIVTGGTDVTQLPASIGVAASFDPSVAYDYGQVLGAEARGQGVDDVQAPNLNLARLPNSGRIFEGYGEDPDLVSAMGVADIDGIQSEGVMASAKHYTAYTQETARVDLDQVVTPRALEELYSAPFAAAVEQGHVAAVMCAYGQIDGVSTCDDPALLDQLRDWGFTGFVRSDFFAVADPAAAIDDGVDLVKPASAATLAAAVADGDLPIGVLDRAVVTVLADMFSYGLIRHPLTGRPWTDVRTSGHDDVALSTAERSMVLLRDRGGVLPLDRSGLRSVAVIGVDAGPGAMTTGFGSARVAAPLTQTPLDAIRRWVARSTAVTFSTGGTGGQGTPSVAGGVADLTAVGEPGVVTPAVSTADQPGSGPAWETWSTSIDPSRTGLYDFALTTGGDTWLSVDGTDLIAEPGLHQPAPWSATASLVAGRPVTVELRWFDAGVRPTLAWSDVSPAIAAAVSAARRANVAVVFASDFTSEGFDRPALALPGDADALIEAVAAANPKTVVVLNTGGAVLMPWLSKVAAVVEGWYPGASDGPATVAVLSGAVDPSGHLPVTFPATDAASAMGSSASWPGVDGQVNLGGLDIGYRGDDAAGIAPLFPFGFGLSYTTFSLSAPSAQRSGRGYRIELVATDTGRRAGRAVVEAYLTDPASAEEPPRTLQAFTSVSLLPGQHRRISLDLPGSAFDAFLGGRFQVVPGTYTLWIGQSERSLPLRLRLQAPIVVIR